MAGTKFPSFSRIIKGESKFDRLFPAATLRLKQVTRFPHSNPLQHTQLAVHCACFELWRPSRLSRIETNWIIDSASRASYYHRQVALLCQPEVRQRYIFENPERTDHKRQTRKIHGIVAYY